MSEIVKWIWVSFLVFASFMSILDKDEPRSVTALAVLVQGLLIASILTYWVK